MDKQQQIDRAFHAKRLLEDEVFVDAIQQIEQEIYTEWRTTALGDHQHRSDLFHTLKGLERLKTRLQAILDDGVMASRN